MAKTKFNQAVFEAISSPLEAMSYLGECWTPKLEIKRAYRLAKPVLCLEELSEDGRMGLLLKAVEKSCLVPYVEKQKSNYLRIAIPIK